MGYERPYYQDSPFRPFIFYAVFGAVGGDLKVSRQRHRVDEFPEGLEMSLLERQKHGAYMDGLLSGTLGDVLRRSEPAIYEAGRAEDCWAVIRGEPQKDTNLGYLRNSIGFVQALLETGADGVMDLQTITLYTPEEWKRRIFEPELDPRAHVVILISEMEDGRLWLHTRGMRKFGRPDIGIENVPANETGPAGQIVDQMIYYSALGALFTKPAKLHAMDRVWLVRPELTGSIDDPDFNNAHYCVRWNEVVDMAQEDDL